MLAAVLALATAVANARVVDDEPGFGGSGSAVPADAGDGSVGEPAKVDDADDAPATVDRRDATTSTASLPTWKPPDGEESTSSPTVATKLELELQKAGLDPQRYPLLRLRVDAARLSAALDEAERKGLSAAREVEARWVEARALLADVERVALFRMHRCAVRAGRATEVKRFRVTAGGAVPFSTDELVAQASALDPPGCARIDVIDDALVDKVKRARFLKATLPTTTFSFHELDRRRALEDELAALKKELAGEGGPSLLVAGDRGYSR